MLNYEEFPLCVGVVGSRSFRENEKGDMNVYNAVRSFMNKLNKATTIVSGGAPGVDSYAEDIAYVRKMKTQIFHPDKSISSPARFHKRNTEIVQYVHKHEGILVAFMDETDCRGTTTTLNKAKKLGVPCIEVYFTPKGKFLRMKSPDDFVLM